MRTKTSAERPAGRAHDDDILDPLPVYDDGARLEPVPASREHTAADARVLVRECVGALQAVLDERTAVRSESPWTSVERVSPPVPRPGRYLATFSRMIALHPDRLAALPDWWARNERDGLVAIAHRLVLAAPQRAPGATWRFRTRLVPSSVAPVRGELLLWPHLGLWTKMTLEPQRDVHCSRRYFRTGHRALDTLTARLITELD